MKKLTIFIPLLIIICLMLPLAMTVASDITDASYRGTIQATNNGTLAENVAANFTLSTEDLIDSGILNASANNVVARDQNSNDVAFMPGYNGNPWLIFYDSISAGTSQSSYIYTGSVTGGLLRYFPGTAGMIVPDTMAEPGDNFSLQINDLFINTTAGANKIIFSHYDDTNGGIQGQTSDTTSGTVEFEIDNKLIENSDNASCLSYDGTGDYARKTASVVSPSGSEISIEAWGYRDAINAYHTIYRCGSAATKFYLLRFNNDNKILFNVSDSTGGAYAAAWVSTNTTAAGTWYHIVATYKDGVGTTVYVNGMTWGGNDTGVGGDIWQPDDNLVIGASAALGELMVGDIDEVRVSDVARTGTEAKYHYNSGTGRRYNVDANTISLWHKGEGAGATLYDETGNNDLTITGATWVLTSPVTLKIGDTITLSASGLSTSEYDIEVSENTTSFNLYIDGVLTDNTTKLSVPDSTANWSFGSANTTPYIGSIEYDVGGVPVSAWDWEYGATFYDSIGSNDATPSFRLTSSDSDVTTALISFESLNKASADAGIISGWPEMITEAPDQPSTMYSENSSPSIFFAGIIDAIWPDDIPISIFWYNFSFGTIFLGSILSFYFFAKKGQNALLLKSIVSTAIMIFWALPGPNVYGFYIVLYHIFWCFGIMVLSRNYGW